MLNTLQPAQNLQRLSPGLHRVHQGKDMTGILLVLDPLAEGMDGEREFFRKAPVIAGARLLVRVFPAGTGKPVIMDMGRSRSLFIGCSRLFCTLCVLRILRSWFVLCTDDTECPALDFEQGFE